MKIYTSSEYDEAFKEKYYPTYEEIESAKKVLEFFINGDLTKVERLSIDNVHTLLQFYGYELKTGNSKYVDDVYGVPFSNRKDMIKKEVENMKKEIKSRYTVLATTKIPNIADIEHCKTWDIANDYIQNDHIDNFAIYDTAVSGIHIETVKKDGKTLVRLTPELKDLIETYLNCDLDEIINN